MFFFLLFLFVWFCSYCVFFVDVWFDFVVFFICFFLIIFFFVNVVLNESMGRATSDEHIPDDCEGPVRETRNPEINV